jgi:hypothetical protein
VRAAELAEIGVATVDADTDAKLDIARADLLLQRIAPLGKALLDRPRRKQRLRRMVALLTGKLKIASTASPIVLLSSPSWCQIAAAQSS